MGQVKNDAWRRIEELYYLGYEADEIARIMNCEIDFVKACCGIEED